VYSPKGRARIASEVDAVKKIVGPAGKELTPLGWMARLLFLVAGAILLIWIIITAIRWFWNYLG
jgi:hypothetical protein